jgi:hypothetical protein
MNPPGSQSAKSQIDSEKMLRFAQWLFSEEPNAKSHDKDQPRNAKSSEESAA